MNQLRLGNGAATARNASIQNTLLCNTHVYVCIRMYTYVRLRISEACIIRYPFLDETLIGLRIGCKLPMQSYTLVFCM